MGFTAPRAYRLFRARTGSGQLAERSISTSRSRAILYVRLLFPSEYLNSTWEAEAWWFKCFSRRLKIRDRRFSAGSWVRKCIIHLFLVPFRLPQWSFQESCVDVLFWERTESTLGTFLGPQISVFLSRRETQNRVKCGGCLPTALVSFTWVYKGLGSGSRTVLSRNSTNHIHHGDWKGIHVTYLSPCETPAPF